MIDINLIQEISEDIVHKSININVTTGLRGTNKKGSISIIGDSAYIDVNPEYATNTDSLLEIVAHELAHITLNRAEHGDGFDKEKKRIFKQLKNKIERR